MSSGRTAQRRGTTPIHLSTHPKPVISVEDWEAKAPLGELETRSVSVIKAASEKASLPSKVWIFLLQPPHVLTRHPSSTQLKHGPLVRPHQFHATDLAKALVPLLQYLRILFALLPWPRMPFIPNNRCRHLSSSTTGLRL